MRERFSSWMKPPNKQTTPPPPPNNLFVCLVLFSHLCILPLFGDVTVADEWLQILTYARHLWPLNSEDSLACHMYCDMSSPRTRDTHTCCQTLGSGAVTTCFYDLGLSRLGFEFPNFRLRGEALTHCVTLTDKNYS